MKAKKLLLSNLQSTLFKIFLLLISISKQSANPEIRTSKEIQLINKGFPRANSIRPRGTNIRSAKSINGKNISKHIKNLDFLFSFFFVS